MSLPTPVWSSLASDSFRYQFWNIDIGVVSVAAVLVIAECDDLDQISKQWDLATIFFLVSPVAEGQSELLARTSPTIYDVFIALMGGLAGVTPLSTKEKGNVIPGVAIATALMPPLCTAGYGLATGNLIYFLGAFYLYFINSVFIIDKNTVSTSLATMRLLCAICISKSKSVKARSPRMITFVFF